jgi:hypothetical protein
MAARDGNARICRRSPALAAVAVLYWFADWQLPEILNGHADWHDIRNDEPGVARSDRYTLLVIEPGVSKTSSPSGSRTVARVIVARGCRLSDTPGRATEAQSRKPAQCGLDIDEKRQQEEPSPRRRGRRPLRDVTVKHIELQDTGVVVGNSRVAEEDRAHAAARRVEQILPVTFNLPVLQQVKAEPVPVEAQAGFEVADHHRRMMNASGHSTRG